MKKSQDKRNNRYAKYALLPVSKAVKDASRQALNGKGGAFGGLIMDWTQIMGERLAKMAVPQKISFDRQKKGDAVLHLGVYGAGALELQHQSVQICQRVNNYFGYRAVSQIKLNQLGYEQGVKMPRIKPVKQICPTKKQEVANQVSSIEDERLRKALSGFGEAVALRQDIA